jgi:hypothetical protein
MLHYICFKILSPNTKHGKIEVFNYEHIQRRTKLKVPHSWCHLPDKGVVSLVECGWYLHNMVAGPLAADVAALKSGCLPVGEVMLTSALRIHCDC